MNNSSISKINRFGRVGVIIINILLVLYVGLTVVFALVYYMYGEVKSDYYVASLTRQAVITMSEEDWRQNWQLLLRGYSYTAADGSLVAGGGAMPPEEQPLQTDILIGDQAFQRAVVRTENGQKVIAAASQPVEYSFGKFLVMCTVNMFYVLCVSVALGLLKRVFRELARCATPFSEAVVAKIRLFSYSLLALAIYKTVAENLTFLYTTQSFTPVLDWTSALAFGVVWCLATVFSYGVALQKEADETL